MSFGNVFLRAQFAGLVQAAFACRVVLQADKDASSCGSKNRKCVSALPFPFQQCIIGSIFPVHALLNSQKGDLLTVLMPEPKGTRLGQATTYAEHYSPDLLQPIPRALGRDAIGDHDFQGADIWRLYEFSWLDHRGLPHAAEVELAVPASTPSIIESKSLKLYAMSFAMTKLADAAEAEAILTRDLSQAAGGAVQAKVNPLRFWETRVAPMPGDNLEEMLPETKVDAYEVSPDLLQSDSGAGEREVYWSTNIFRSLCPVTGQPDFASVSVHLAGEAVDPASLLRYLASYRQHRGFHEQCVEQIFHDLWSRFDLKVLEVQAAFTRRGGIDINPFRSNVRDIPLNSPRELRQ